MITTATAFGTSAARAEQKVSQLTRYQNPTEPFHTKTQSRFTGITAQDAHLLGCQPNRLGLDLGQF
jgi:hypothetical protein